MNPFEKYKEILAKYITLQDVLHLVEQWNDPKRKYHNISHLKQILEDLEKSKHRVLPIHWDAFVLASFFHDAIYVIGAKDNEERSIQTFMRCYKGKDFHLAKKVGEMIEATKYRKIPSDPLIRIFWEADNAGFKKSFESFLKSEELIRQEFSSIYSKDKYKEGRIKFLESCLGTMGPKADENIKNLLSYIQEKY